MNKPLIFAHRGASAYAPENTIPSFQKAIELNADGVELDIQLSKDGQIVVVHDETINRTSNGTGWVKDYTLEELKQFRFNTLHPEYENVTIPTMQEVIDVIKPSNLCINIELKTGIIQYPHIEEMILELIHKNDMDDRVIYSSFHHPSCAKIKELKKDAYIGFLTRDGIFDLPQYAKDHNANALNPALYQLLYPNFVKDCHELGVDINVWTVDDPEHIKQALDLGVHSIISNKPDLVRQLLEERQ